MARKKQITQKDDNKINSEKKVNGLPKVGTCNLAKAGTSTPPAKFVSHAVSDHKPTLVNNINKKYFKTFNPINL